LVRILTLLNFSFPSITPKGASPEGFTLFQFVLLTLESFVYFSPAFPQSSTWCCTQCQELQGTHFGTQSSLFSLFPLRLYPPSLQKLAAVPLRDTVYSFKPTSHPKPQWVSPGHQLDHAQPPWSKPHLLKSLWNPSQELWSQKPLLTKERSKSRKHQARAGIRSVRTGSDPWTDTEPEVIRSTTEPSFLTSVRSFKAVRTDIIGTEQRSEPTDVESGFLYVRTEPIGKMVPSTEPNRLST